MEYYSAIKKNEILPFATTWMDVEGIMLSENKPDRKRQLPYDFVDTWNLKNSVNKQTKQKQVHRFGEQTDGWQGEGGCETG